MALSSSTGALSGAQRHLECHTKLFEISSHRRSYPSTRFCSHWCKVTVLLVTSPCLIAPVIAFSNIFSAELISTHTAAASLRCSNVRVFVLTFLPRFIQEIEMNMGPGQAKQCQLRAFLTYYINDLFLNQVSEMTKWYISFQSNI